MTRTRSAIRQAARTYKLRPEQVKAMVRADTCQCCGRPRKGDTFHVDHNHTTGKVRGMLCRDCNTGIIANLDNSIHKFGYVRAFKRCTPLTPGDYFGVEKSCLAGQMLPGDCWCCGDMCERLLVCLDFEQGRVLGLTCAECQMVLKSVNNPVLLDAAIAYLDRYG
jgi:hypothetical protein